MSWEILALSSGWLLSSATRDDGEVTGRDILTRVFISVHRFGVHTIMRAREVVPFTFVLSWS